MQNTLTDATILIAEFSCADSGSGFRTAGTAIVATIQPPQGRSGLQVAGRALAASVVKSLMAELVWQRTRQIRREVAIALVECNTGV